VFLLFPVSASALEPENDPCNYHGLKVCNSSGECDDERFDCYTDDCVNGKTGITGQCDGDDDTVWCWDSQENNGECISTLLVINLSNSNVLNNNSYLGVLWHCLYRAFFPYLDDFVMPYKYSIEKSLCPMNVDLIYMMMWLLRIWPIKLL
jgi:hypothetical protein